MSEAKTKPDVVEGSIVDKADCARLIEAIEDGPCENAICTSRLLPPTAFIYVPSTQTLMLGMAARRILEKFVQDGETPESR